MATYIKQFGNQAVYELTFESSDDSPFHHVINRTKGDKEDCILKKQSKIMDESSVIVCRLCGRKTWASFTWESDSDTCQLCRAFDLRLPATIKNLKLKGKCPICYGEVKYIGRGPQFKCKKCGAKLEKQHVMQGADSLQRVNKQPYIFFND